VPPTRQHRTSRTHHDFLRGDAHRRVPLWSLVVGDAGGGPRPGHHTWQERALTCGSSWRRPVRGTNCSTWNTRRNAPRGTARLLRPRRHAALRRRRRGATIVSAGHLADAPTTLRGAAPVRRIHAFRPRRRSAAATAVSVTQASTDALPNLDRPAALPLTSLVSPVAQCRDRRRSPSRTLLPCAAAPRGVDHADPPHNRPSDRRLGRGAWGTARGGATARSDAIRPTHLVSRVARRR
jgi:hypothetical protein